MSDQPVRPRLVAPRPQRVELFYPQVELLRAQRRVRRDRRAQWTARVVTTAIVLGLYWMFFSHIR